MSFSEEQTRRYARHILLPEIGGTGQARLLASRVLVVGAGGLGSPLILYLAAAGVGTITVVDDDVVDLSNLQRQVLHATSRLGQPKTASAAAAVADLNPDVRLVPVQARLTAATIDALIADQDVVADGSDNFDTRFLINDACRRAGRTLVSAAIRRFDGQLSTFRADGPCYRCLHPEMATGGDGPTCADAGVLGSVAGTLGTMQATEIVKEVLGIGESLSGRLLRYDALKGTVTISRLSPDPACPTCGSHG